MLVNDVKLLKFNFQQMSMSKLRVLPMYNLVVSNFKLNLNIIIFTFYTQFTIIDLWKYLIRFENNFIVCYSV